MAAPKGNQLWRLRETHGRPKAFECKEELWEACSAYFEWVEANPLIEEKPFAFQGVITYAKVKKMRAMTQCGLCLHLGITEDTWRNYLDPEHDFFEVATRADRIIYEQKFTGAAAEQLNPNIIARDLGLADKKELESPNGTMTPVYKVVYGDD